MKRFFIFVSLSLLVAEVFAQTCKCGIETPTGRIIGGSSVSSISKMPWMAMITDSRKSPFCGGTIIASRAVLTAAHCLQSTTASEVKVVTGVLRRNEVNSGNMIGVRRIINHPQFSDSTAKNDISILILDREIDLTQHSPICVPSQKTSYGTLCVAGWGFTREFAVEPSEDLLDVCFTENDFNTCDRNITRSSLTSKLGNLNPNTQITAGADGKGACPGDSGGPLYANISGRSTQVGIVSFGLYECGKPCDVYTRVTGFYSWIQETVSQNGGGYQCQ